MPYERINGEQHGPLAAMLLETLCGVDPLLWRQAELGAREALRTRLAFWDQIEREREPERSENAADPRT